MKRWSLFDLAGWAYICAALARALWGDARGRALRARLARAARLAAGWARDTTAAAAGDKDKDPKSS